MNGYFTTGQSGPVQVLPTRQITVDFGPLPLPEQEFIIIDPDVTPTARILAQVDLEPAAGKDADEPGMEQCFVQVGVDNIASGTFTLHIRAVDGSYLHDKFLVNYQVSF
jgi:hypothetical protein